MKSFRLKTLSAAVFALAGLGMANVAFAVCTANADPKTPNGAWAGKTQLSGGAVNVTGPGMNGTSCALYTTITAGSSLSAATVTDTSPNNEPRYRFRFYFDPSALGAFGTFDGVQVATVASATNYPVSGGRRNVMTISLVPSAAGKTLSFSVACNNPGTLYRCTSTAPVDLVNGPNTFEADMPFSASPGTNSTIRYWINAPVGSTDATAATASIVVDNAGWSVKQFTFGMANPTNSFAGAHSGQAFVVDEFDSRRQTFIGP